MRLAGRAQATCVFAFLCLSLLLHAPQARAQNEIALENALPGNPPSEWDVTGAGDPSIQGFATDISVNHGRDRPVQDRHATRRDYRIDIYRLG